MNLRRNVAYRIILFPPCEINIRQCVQNPPFAKLRRKIVAEQITFCGV